MIDHLLLEGNVSINVQVRDLLREKSSFKNQPDWVTVLDGSQEGAYEWVRCWPCLSIYALNHYSLPRFLEMSVDVPCLSKAQD
jgi:hypothetical protein